VTRFDAETAVSTDDDDFMTVADVARVLKLNQQTVRNWINAGTLPALHIGRRVRIGRSDFDRLVGGGYSGGGAVEEPASASIWDGEIPPPTVP
jgi:excisionase family DNA binding protein